MYDFKIVSIAGKDNIIEDTFSRYPVNDNNGASHSSCNKLTFDYLRVYPTEEDQFNAMDMDNKIEVAVIVALTAHDGWNITSITIDRIKAASLNDTRIQRKICRMIYLQQFWNVRHDLTLLDGIILYQYHIVVPLSLRREVLEVLHSVYQGTTVTVYIGLDLAETLPILSGA